MRFGYMVDSHVYEPHFIEAKSMREAIEMLQSKLPVSRMARQGADAPFVEIWADQGRERKDMSFSDLQGVYHLYPRLDGYFTYGPDPWELTDPDSLQVRREVYPQVFELIQVDEYPTPGERYLLAQTTIDHTEYSEEEIQSALDGYGYSSFSELIDATGSEREAYGQLAEMLFELNSNEFYVQRISSWNEAVDEVQERADCDLQALKDVALDERISAAAAQKAPMGETSAREEQIR